jgi:hypothetical protein
MGWQLDQYYEQASELLPLLYVGVALAIGLLLSFNYFVQLRNASSDDGKPQTKKSE